MKNTITCGRCGHGNDLAHVFCLKCGAKLDFSHIQIHAAARPGASWGARLVFLLRILVFVVMVSCLGLVFWPTSPSGAAGDGREGLLFSAKLNRLEQAAMNAQPITETASEAELNGYLLEVLRRNPQISQSSGMTMGIEALNLRLRPDGFLLYVGARWSMIPLTYEIRGMPRVNGRQFTVEILPSRWGHLPLPKSASSWLADRVGALFAQLSRERALLDRLNRMDLEPGMVRVSEGRAN